MKILSLVLLTLVAQNLFAQIKTVPVDKKKVPQSIRYSGHIKDAVEYNDVDGQHLIITTETGNVDVKDVTGSLKINNVNGAISIANAKGTTDAHTINGNLTVTYLSVPPDASNYYTLNGKLEVTYPANLSANLQFKSMNGQFYTDFDNTEFLPTQVEMTHNKGNGSTTYKLNKNTPVKVGAGGKLFKFETLNGNIYIKKQS